MYIYNLPYSKRAELQRMLDVGEHWRKLAARLNWSADKVFYMGMAYQRPGGSPTELLLMEWGHSNATVEMLVFHLLQLNLNRAAELFRGMVPDAMFTTVDNGSLVVGTISTPTSFSGINQITEPLDLPLPAIDQRLVALDSSMNLSSSNGFRFQQNTRDSCKLNDVFSTSSSRNTQSDNASLQNCELNELNAPGKMLNVGLSYVISSHPGRMQAVESVDIGTATESNLRHPVSPSQMSSAGTAGIPSNVFQYKFKTIADATNNFSPDHLIGCGDFGAVYRGRITNTVYAIKKMYKVKEGRSDYNAEINILHTYRHTNISMLCGCSVDGPDVCLVFEYMVNGSLYDRLLCKNGSPVLLWQHRHRILMGAASGLQYLHAIEPKPVLHGDIKSSNILLGPHFEAKISDFGLAREATSGTAPGRYTHVTVQQQVHLCETYAYLPSEFLTSNRRFGIKTDVYSFGVVIYETCTGLRVYDASRTDGELLVDYVGCLRSDKTRLLKVKDSRTSGWPDMAWLKMMAIGDKCSSARREDRPAILEVHRDLEHLINTVKQSDRDEFPVKSSKDSCHQSAKQLPVDDFPARDKKLDTDINTQRKVNDNDFKDVYGDYRTTQTKTNTEQTSVKQGTSHPVKSLSTEKEFASDMRQTVSRLENQLLCDVTNAEQFAQLRLAEENCEVENRTPAAAQDTFSQRRQRAVENEITSPVPASLSEIDMVTKKKKNSISDEWSILFADIDDCTPATPCPVDVSCDRPSRPTTSQKPSESSQQQASGSRSFERFDPVGSGVMLVDSPLTLAPEDQERVARMERLQASMSGSSHG